jgi:hypothetical protein
MYASFMEEIKWRFDEINRRIDGVKKKQDLAAVFEIELCYLQVRFICELIALASLAAHHSYGLKKDLLKEWHADQIFADLEEINEHCFPWPIRLGWDDHGERHVADDPARAMTRGELKDIYGKCGNSLHRGVLKHALAGRNRIYDVDELMRWTRKLSGLLVEHSIVFPHDERAVLVGLFGGPNGEVAVLELEADGPFSVQRPDPENR